MLVREDIVCLGNDYPTAIRRRTESHKRKDFIAHYPRIPDDYCLYYVLHSLCVLLVLCMYIHVAQGKARETTCSSNALLYASCVSPYPPFRKREDVG